MKKMLIASVMILGIGLLFFCTSKYKEQDITTLSSSKQELINNYTRYGITTERLDNNVLFSVYPLGAEGVSYKAEVEARLRNNTTHEMLLNYSDKRQYVFSNLDADSEYTFHFTHNENEFSHTFTLDTLEEFVILEK